ncbi:MAG: hypothetical protein QM674_12830 [Burkholderiaceae bacterium]
MAGAGAGDVAVPRPIGAAAAGGAGVGAAIAGFGAASDGGGVLAGEGGAGRGCAGAAGAVGVASAAGAVSFLSSDPALDARSVSACSREVPRAYAILLRPLLQVPMIFQGVGSSLSSTYRSKAGTPFFRIFAASSSLNWSQVCAWAWTGVGLAAKTASTLSKTGWIRSLRGLAIFSISVGRLGHANPNRPSLGFVTETIGRQRDRARPLIGAAYQPD